MGVPVQAVTAWFLKNNYHFLCLTFMVSYLYIYSPLLRAGFTRTHHHTLFFYGCLTQARMLAQQTFTYCTMTLTPETYFLIGTQMHTGMSVIKF